MKKLTSDEAQYILSQLKCAYDDLRDEQLRYEGAERSTFGNDTLAKNRRCQEKILGHKVERAGYSHK